MNPEVVKNITDLVTSGSALIAACAAVYAAWVGIKTFIDSATARLAQTLIEAEKSFKESLPLFAMVEDDHRYQATVVPAINKALADAPLTDEELGLLASVDRAVRFFYIFLVHRRFQKDSNLILTAYLYYWALISNKGKRPRAELRAYIDRFYPGTAWSPNVDAFR